MTSDLFFRTVNALRTDISPKTYNAKMIEMVKTNNKAVDRQSYNLENNLVPVSGFL